MPTYVYKFVKTGETIEVQQPITDKTLTAVVHPRSGRKMAVKKVFTPVGVTFRGEGFYKTDSRAKPTKAKSDSKKDDAGTSTSSESTSESTKSDKSKSAAKKADSSKPAKP
jgi:predicted nucleic acid-binding Zn ribbon protein